MSDYFYPVDGARWTTRFLLGGQYIYLTQNERLRDERIVCHVFEVLGIQRTRANVEKYFPRLSWYLDTNEEPRCWKRSRRKVTLDIMNMIHDHIHHADAPTRKTVGV